jgi:SAM-dependent methyltransferase
MDERELWDDVVGDAWVEFAEVLDAHSAPFGEAALDALAIAAGERVLDVGCGTGETTRRLGTLVGTPGRAIGIDLSTRAIGHARSITPALPQVTFVAGDVLTEQLDAPVDAIYSRFGVMFFDHPVDAFDRLRSLLVPGGRMAFAAWQDPFSNPWMLEPVIASAAVLGPPDLPAPGAPGPFSLPSAEVITATLTDAGWTDVEVEALSIEQPFRSGDARSTATMMSRTNPLFATALRQSPDKRDALVDAVAEVLRPHERDGLVTAGAAASIVRATSAD